MQHSYLFGFRIHVHQRWAWFRGDFQTVRDGSLDGWQSGVFLVFNFERNVICVFLCADVILEFIFCNFYLIFDELQDGKTVIWTTLEDGKSLAGHD